AAQSRTVTAYVGRAECYLDMGNAFAATQDYSAAIRLSADDPSLYLHRASAYVLIGNRSAADADFKKVGDIPSSEPQLIMGAAQGLSGMGFYSDALELVDRWLKSYPDYWGLHK